MASPYKTVDKIIDIIKKHVPKENLSGLLKDLETTLIDSKNQSYNETIKRIIGRFLDVQEV